MTAPADNYSIASGQTMYFGRAAPSAPITAQAFDSVAIVSENDGPPDSSDNGKILILEVHGSSGQNTTNGRQYRANVSGSLAYGPHTVFAFSTVKTYIPNAILLRPIDQYGTQSGGAPKESMWIGFKNMPDASVHMITKRRVDSLLEWAKTNLSVYNQTKTCITGGSMGGWGSMTYGIRHPDKFAAIYPDRPRWRFDASGNIPVSDYNGGIDSVPIGSAPSFAAEDGGGSVAAYWDSIAYVQDTSKKVPWIGWCIGRNDGFAPFSDMIAAVAAMRAAKRGFAFVWNDGNHTGGSVLSQITSSYPFGTFEIGKGYPLFTQHSGDQNPSVDLVGGINEGLSFRNVVESAGAWSCEVTSLLGARTVYVEPISDTFKAAVTAQLVTIPAANTWVPVSFSA